MVGQAECHSAFLKWFETKAWHTEESTIAIVLEGFLKRKTSSISENYRDLGPFTKPLLKRISEKIGPRFRIQLCGKMTFQQLAQTLNRLTHDASLYVFGRSYNELPTDEHRLFIIENLDTTPEDTKLFLSNHANHIVRRIQSELIEKRSIPEIENDLSITEFTNPTDFWLHLYYFKKLYEKLKENSIILSYLPLKDVYIDYIQALEHIEQVLENSSNLLNLCTKQRIVKSNLLILPPQIALLTHLTTLSLDHNRLAYLPFQIGALTHLTQLSLRDNDLTYLPNSFQNLTNLTQLGLRQNSLSSLPDGFERLTNLELLDLSLNILSTVPQVLNGLSALAKLSFSGNPLTSVSLNTSNLPRLVYFGLKAIQVTLIENRELDLLRKRKCEIGGGHVQSLLEALPHHPFLLMITFLPWQDLHVIAGLNRHFNQYAKSLIQMRENISMSLFFSPFQEIEEAERNFLTRHLHQTQFEISIKITKILQKIERICAMIQNDIESKINYDENENEDEDDTETVSYSTEKIKKWLSYDYFENDQEAFLDHLQQFKRLAKQLNQNLRPDQIKLSPRKAFHSYEYCLYDISYKKAHSKNFSYIDSALLFLPPELSKFRELKTLTLIQLYLSSLPNDLRDLPHLTRIYLNQNIFKEIPGVLFHCLNLKTIAMIDNFITHIPDDIENLQSLEVLTLQKNRITQIPNVLARLPHLRKLILTENPIQSLPDSMMNLVSLIDFRIDLEWSALSSIQQLWLLRQKHQKMKVTGIQIPDHLMQIPVILEDIKSELQEIQTLKPLAKIEASFSPEAFGDNLAAFLDYLQQFADSVIQSNGRIPPKKKHQINPTELSFSYKGYRLCLKTLESSAAEKSPDFKVRNTFNTLNTLTFLPLNIRQLSHVRHINLQRNRLTYIHQDIWALPLLETLKLDWNQLTDIPDGIHQSPHLRVLSLSHNPLHKLPSDIEKTKLEKLKLNHTSIVWTDMPHSQKRWLRKSIKTGITTGISSQK